MRDWEDRICLSRDGAREEEPPGTMISKTLDDERDLVGDRERGEALEGGLMLDSDRK